MLPSATLYGENEVAEALIGKSPSSDPNEFSNC